MRADNVGALEALFSQGRGDLVEITFDHNQRRFVATLLEDYDPDEEDEEQSKELLELEDGENQGLGPGAYEIIEYDEEAGRVSGHLRELVSASGATMVEALLELEIAYRNLLGVG